MKKQFTAAILAATVVLGATFAPELVWQQPLGDKVAVPIYR